MAKHSMRCNVCGRFVTWRDILDDGVCESCAKHLEAYARERSKWLRRALMVLMFLWLLLVAGGWWVYTNTWAGNETTFRQEFFVTGINLQTRERVVGWIDGLVGGNEVSGTVWDRTGQYVVVGRATGCGQFELRSLCCTYNVRVADEVTNDKVKNRKQWQEVWK